MNDPPTDAAYAKDMGVEARLREASHALLKLAEDFKGENLSGDLRAMVDVLAEERARIVRRWD